MARDVDFTRLVPVLMNACVATKIAEAGKKGVTPLYALCETWKHHHNFGINQ
jgi:hypothetical protein